MIDPCRYRGRFAPTPSGPLHLGSLLTALASWLQARRHGGCWLLRIDDLDRERCLPGMDSVILRQLETHALVWDESPRYQSRHLDEYADALERLRRLGGVYACRCTRQQLAVTARPGPDGPVYPGTCRIRALPEPGHALRLRVGDGEIAFVDGWQGEQTRCLDRDVGDFVVLRRDGVPGYQLACAIDEHAQGITEVVRGADLLGSTFQQLVIMDALQLRRPAYRHLPVLAGIDGRKLSKQNRAQPLVSSTAGENLWRCLDWLGQSPPSALRAAPAAELLRWGLAHWEASRVPAQTRITVDAPADGLA